MTDNTVAAAVQANIDPAYHRVMASRANKPTQAALDVLAERQRQIDKEGWTPEHDDEHRDTGLVHAAMGYMQAAACELGKPTHKLQGTPLFWPWEPESFKSTTPRRDLIKAAALILAEIERIDRAQAVQPDEPPKLTREQWNAAYAAHMAERSGMTLAEALSVADSADDYFNDDETPADAADEEMSNWTD